MIDFSLVGSNIRSNRLNVHLTQETLAEKLEVTPDYISKIENGVKRPSLSMLENLGEIFEIDVYTLLTNPDSIYKANSAMDQKLFSKIKNWEPETKRLLFKIAESMTEVDKEIRKHTK